MKRLVTAALTDGSSLVCVQFGTCVIEDSSSHSCRCHTDYALVDGTCVRCSLKFPCEVPPPIQPRCVSASSTISYLSFSSFLSLGQRIVYPHCFHDILEPAPRNPESSRGPQPKRSEFCCTASCVSLMCSRQKSHANSGTRRGLGFRRSYCVW